MTTSPSLTISQEQESTATSFANNELTALQATVKENESLWQAILEASNDGVWDWNVQTNEAKYSKRWKSILGYDEHEILPKHDEWVHRIHPDDQQYVAESLQTYLTGLAEAYNVECRLKSKDDSYRWIRSRGTLISRSVDGKPLRMVGTHTDITENKLREEQRLSEEIALRDTLVREVHHRIKNNLQGVIGLLCNFNEKNAALNIPIREAIGQIQSIAIIHGLQGRRSTAKVRLCELLTEIALQNKRLWITDVNVNIPPNWIPHLISESEAVPIALICNELTTNAIKHGKANHPVNISLSHTPLNDAVRVCINNIGQLPAFFGNSGVDLGQLHGSHAGLQLITSLLPKKNANLRFEQQGDYVVVTLDIGFSIAAFERKN